MKRILYILAALMAVTVSANAADVKTVTLSNDRVSMTFKAEGKWGMDSYTQDGKELLVKGGSTAPLWKITYLGDQGETPLLNPSICTYKGATMSEDGRSVTFEWTAYLVKEDKWPIKATVTLPEKDSELAEWTISADLPKKWVISQIEYPRISVARPEGVKGIMSVGYGAEYPLPESGDMIQSTYPSCTGALELIMAYNPEGTWYFAADDRKGAAKFFQIKGEYPAMTFVQKLDTSFGWTDKDGHFEIPWSALFGYNADSWENTAVKWYRPFALTCEWGEKSISERNIAEWIKNADVWIRPQNVTEEQMEGVRKSIATFGEGLGIHWYYWHQYPHDVMYPEYFPAQEHFKEYVAEAQALGGHVTPYTNGRLWDAGADSYKKQHAAKASCRKMDGNLYTEVYSSKAINTVTCPASEKWQKVQRGISSTLLNEFGTDGVYIDQIGAAASEPCYATNHGHAKGAGDFWPQAYRKLITGMRQDIYKPGQAITTEEDAECYIDLFDMMLIVNGPHTPTVHMVPLFPLIYSDRCIYSGFTYIPWWCLNNGSGCFITMKSLLWGSQLGWINPTNLFKAGNETVVQFIKTLGEFRKANHDVFVGGRFMGEFVPGGDANPVIDVPGYQKTNVVMGANWKTVDGKDAVILVNMNGWSRKVTLPDGREATVPAYGAIRL